MKTKLLALLLAAMMLLSLCACGNDAKSSGAAEPSAAAEETPAQAPADDDAETPAAPADAEESTAEQEGSYGTIEYPIPGDHTFSMTSVTRMNVADALGEDDYSVTLSYAALAEATGVNIEFEMLPETSYLDTLNLRIASEEFPDMFSQTVGSYDSKLQSAVETEILVDLRDYLDHAPDWARVLDSNKDYYDAVVNGDGSLAVVAGTELGKTTQMGLVRGDWLEEQNLKAPTTLDELTEVLKVFKEKYNTPNALLINSDLDSAAEFAFNFTAMGFKMVNFQLTEPGSTKVVCGHATDAYVDYLEYLHALYEDGLITDDFLSTSKENGNWESSFYSGKCGVWQDDCKFADTAYAAMADTPDWRAEPFAFSGEDYHMMSTNAKSLTTAYISTSCDEPEAAMEFLNYGFTEEGRALVAYGVEGETYTVDNDGNISYTDVILNNPDGLTYDQATVCYLVSNWMPGEAEERSLSIKYTPAAVDAINLWSDKGGDGSMTIPTAAQPTGDDMLKVFDLAGDVLTHLSEVAPKVILGDATGDDYRAAVEECKDMGLTEMTEIYQAAYDDYLAG